MRKTEERITALHRRAEELRRRSEKRILAGWGIASGVLFSVLAMLIVCANGPGVVVMTKQMAGSSLLDENTGGYVLTAVAAFWAGAVLTLVILRYRGRHKDRKNKRQVYKTVEGNDCVKGE